MAKEEEKVVLTAEKLVEEAKAALKDQNRTKSDNKNLNEALVAIGGGALGGGVSFAALYFAGTAGLSAVGITSALGAAGSLIGGGMVAGIFVIAAPIALGAVTCYGIAKSINHSKEIEKREMLLQEVIRLHEAIINELNEKSNKNQERIDYLTKLNNALQSIIKDLSGIVKGNTKAA